MSEESALLHYEALRNFILLLINSLDNNLYTLQQVRKLPVTFLCHLSIQKEHVSNLPELSVAEITFTY